MSWLHGTVARLRLLLARRASEARFDTELEFHLAMEAERLAREEGLAPDEARRRALAAFGGVAQAREALRAGRGTMWLNGWSLDLTLGWRMLWKHPGLTLVAVLGIAVAVAIGVLAFAAVQTVTSTSLPVDEGDRVVAITNMDRRAHDEARETHLHDLAVWRESLRSVRELGAWRTLDRTLAAADAAPSSVRVAEMTASGFRVTRVPALRGRYLLDEDERAGAPSVVVLGFELWQRLGARPDVVGSVVQLGGERHMVVGIMPKGYGFPVNNQVWVPLRLDPLSYERGKAPSIDVFGRLAPGATLRDANLELTTIGERLSAEFPLTHADIRPRISPYTRSFLDGPGVVSLLHLGQVLVSLLLVVIGTNVAVLVYARTANREGELAVRTALGAGRRRIVAQLFAEALVLSLAASVVGVFAAHTVFGILESLLRNSAGDQVPYWMHLELSPGVILYVASLTVLAAVIIGVIPGIKATRHRVSDSLRGLSGGSSMQLGRGWTVMLVTQVAVSVAALPVALMGGVALWQATVHDAGTAATASVVMAVPLVTDDGRSSGDARAEARRRRNRYATAVAEIARRLEDDAGGIDVVRMSSEPGAEDTQPIAWELAAGDTVGLDTARLRSGISVRMNAVDSSFFAAFDMRLLAGRTFSAPDFAEGATPAIVDQSFVRYFLGGGNALGRRFRPVPYEPVANEREAPPAPLHEIVGVVADFPPQVNPDALLPKVYFPLRPADTYPQRLAVRAPALTPAAAADRIRGVAFAVDPTLGFRPIRSLDDLLADQLRTMRLALVGLVSVALSVVLLSAATIFALVAFTVARRRREIGIRCALGARHSRVLVAVLSRAMRQIGLGILIGLGAVGPLARLAGQSDPWVSMLGQVMLLALLMVAFAVIAAIVPARRALLVQPTEALRAE